MLHGYSRGWADGTIYDPPKDGAAEALRQLADRYRLVVYTTRARDEEQREDVWRWLRAYGMASYVEDVTDAKPMAVAYIDDRAIRFEDWKRAVLMVEWLEVEAGVRGVKAGMPDAKTLRDELRRRLEALHPE